MRRNGFAAIVLSLTSIQKSFGRQRVLDDASFSLMPSTTTLLLGANGSGKSTLLRIASGLLRPDKGIRKVGENVVIAYLGHEPMLYSTLTVLENLTLFGTLLKCKEKVEESLLAWDLAAYRDTQVGVLSKGNAIRAGLARAFLRQPSLILLDEPSAALDQPGVQLLLEAVTKAVAAGASALVASHDLARIAARCDRVAVLRDCHIAIDTAQGMTKEVALAEYQMSNR